VGHNRAQPPFAILALLIEMTRELAEERAEVQRGNGQPACRPAGDRILTLEAVPKCIAPEMCSSAYPRALLRTP